MTFMIEIVAEFFGWLGLHHAEKALEQGNRTRAYILIISFLIMLTAFFSYIVYGVVQFFKTY